MVLVDAGIREWCAEARLLEPPVAVLEENHRRKWSGRPRLAAVRDLERLWAGGCSVDAALTKLQALA
jgi:hypothetical protein